MFCQHSAEGSLCSDTVIESESSMWIVTWSTTSFDPFLETFEVLLCVGPDEFLFRDSLLLFSFPSLLFAFVLFPLTPPLRLPRELRLKSDERKSRCFRVLNVGVGDTDPAVYLLSLISVWVVFMSSTIVLNWWMRRTNAMSTCWLIDWQETVKLTWNMFWWCLLSSWKERAFVEFWLEVGLSITTAFMQKVLNIRAGLKSRGGRFIMPCLKTTQDEIVRKSVLRLKCV